jgi:hypothetical protein
VLALQCTPSRWGALTAGAPRLLAPLSGSFAMASFPTLSWEMPPGYSDATVEVCQDIGCTNLLESIAAHGTTARPSLDLTNVRARDNGQLDNTIYWRVRVGEALSRTWMFRPVPGDAKADTAWGNISDFNADAIDDAAVGVPDAGEIRVFPLNGRGVEVSFVLDPCAIPVGAAFTVRSPGPPNFGAAIAVAGDVDGDGYGDLVVGGGDDATSRVTLLRGAAGPAPLGRPQELVFPGRTPSFGRRLAGVGDLDGDGYADVVASDTGAVVVLWGSGAGLVEPTPLVVPGAPDFACVLSSAGDLDGDRLADFAVSADCDGTGRVFVAFGARRRSDITLTEVPLPAGVTSGFGSTLSLGGDGDNDGRSELFAGTRSPERGYLFAARPDRSMAPLAALDQPGVVGFGAAASFDATFAKPAEPDAGPDASDEGFGSPSTFLALEPLILAKGDAAHPGAVFSYSTVGGGSGLSEFSPDETPKSELLDVRPDGPLLLVRGGAGQQVLYPNCTAEGAPTWSVLTEGPSLTVAK